MRFFVKSLNKLCIYNVGGWLFVAVALQFGLAHAQSKEAVKSPIVTLNKPAEKVKTTESSTPIPAQTVLAKSLHGITITAADVMAEFAKLSPDRRLDVMGKPESVGQLVNNLLVRRMLAKEIESDSAITDPVVQSAVAIAKDRILSDIRLQRLDAQNEPNDAAVEKYAQGLYKANLAKYAVPAQNRARHILIEKATPENLKKMQDIRAKILAGGSFEELAKEFSEDKGSGARGGDLGFFGAGQMVKPFEDAVTALQKPGDVSEPVESPFGWHLIKLEERREKSTKSFEEVKQQLIIEAKVSLVNESRVTKVKAMSKDMSFDKEAIESFSKAAVN